MILLSIVLLPVLKILEQMKQKVEINHNLKELKKQVEMNLAGAALVKNIRIAMVNKRQMKNMDKKYEELEKRVSDIEKRNKRVEGDKAWETSTLRKVLILIMTYIFAVLYLKIADTTNPFFGAVVPTVGFYLSTQTLNVIKKKWLSKK